MDTDTARHIKGLFGQCQSKNLCTTQNYSSECVAQDGEGFLESNSQNWNICDRHEWQLEQQYRKGDVDFSDEIK
jgi:hypothetical protein